MRLLAIVSVLVLFLAAFVSVAMGRTIYVDDDALQSWYDSTHVDTIQVGINLAFDGDTVLVYEGTYKERIDFSGKAILLTSRILDQTDTSDIIDSTIIDADPSGLPDTTTYLSVVRFVSGEDSTSVIQGFTIQNGIGADDHPAWVGRYGGGICCHSSSPTIQHNIIKSNSACYGGGIGCIYSAPVIQYNTLTADSVDSAQCPEPGGASGGAIHGYLSAPQIQNNNITGNYSCSGGGGIYLYGEPIGLGSCPSISGNMITDNIADVEGGGVFYLMCHECCGDLSENTIRGNSGGAIWLDWGDPLISRNTIVRNSNGPTIRVEDCDILIENNTIESNTGPYAILAAHAGRFSLINNIISNNSGTAFNCEYSTVSYNNIWNNEVDCGGIGIDTLGKTNFNGTPCDSFYNISQEPMFADTISYALVCSSVCVEAGDPTYRPPDSSGCRIDMGAQEFLYPPCTTCAFIYGDVDSSGAVNGTDVVYLTNYLFYSGPEPRPLESGDVNWDGSVNVADVVYLFNYVYKGGRVPCRQACP